MFWVFSGGPVEPVLVCFVGELMEGVGAVGRVFVVCVGEEGGKVDEEGEFADEAGVR